MRKDPLNSPIAVIILGILFLGITVIGIYTHFAGPCSLYKYSKSSDVPARCIKEYNK